MLAIYALPVLLFAQVATAGLTYPELRELSDILSAEKRYSDKESMHELVKERAKKGKTDYFIEECDQEPIELGIVIDSSASILPGDFRKGQDFLSDFLDHYIIGPDKVRVAVVSFGRGVYTEDGFNLTTYDNNERVVNHVKHMKFRAGTYTDTGDALLHMREVQMAPARPGIPKIVVVLTDGNSQRGRWTARQAQLTKAANITVFAVGVGKAVKTQELLNIAAGNKDNVFRAESYDDLDKGIKDSLTTMTCKLVPKPTTTPPPTTTTMMQTQPCGEEFPTDINFVFNPTAMGIDETSFVTTFISHVVDSDELEQGWRYGVVSGDCPQDEGFSLDKYQTQNAIKKRLSAYDSNKLPTIVNRATKSRFGVSNGGREDARKVAVIFLGHTKVDTTKLMRSIEAMVRSGVHVFVSTKDADMHRVLGMLLPAEATLLQLNDSSFKQSSELLDHLCQTNQK